MIQLGFALPRLQVEIPDPLDPGRSYRVDYYWETPDGIVIGELDGNIKLENPAMLYGGSLEKTVRRERIRESRLTRTGARILRFTLQDVFDRDRFRKTLESFGVPYAR